MGIGNVELVSKFKLPTAVLHVTDIGQRTSLTNIAGNRHLDDHAVGLLDIVIHRECQLIVP